MKNDVLKRIRAIGMRLKRDYRAEKIFLFGSYAWGKATADSDIDLLVIASTSERFLARRATVKRLIRDLSKGLAVAPIVLTRPELRERMRLKDPFLREILSKGKEL